MGKKTMNQNDNIIEEKGGTRNITEKGKSTGRKNSISSESLLYSGELEYLKYTQQHEMEENTDRLETSEESDEIFESSQIYEEIENVNEFKKNRKNVKEKYDSQQQLQE